MLGTSKTSLAKAREALTARVNASNADDVADALLSVTEVLASSAALRGALGDSGSARGSRAALAGSLFADRLDATALEVVRDVVERRWSTGRDMVDAIESLGFEAALIGAEARGVLDTVEDELFRVDRVVAGDQRLRLVLTDPAVPDTTKGDIFADLLGQKADPTTVRLVRYAVTHPRGRKLEDVLAALVTESARRHERLLARVTVADQLTEDQHRRLAAALSRVYGRDVDLQVDVDPSVVGGVVVRVGDEVIDGSVRHRVDQIRRRLGVA